MAETTMVERVADILESALWMHGNPSRQHFVDAAYVAIAVMREPTVAMRKVCTFEEAEVTWPAMVDAALAKSSSGEEGE